MAANVIGDYRIGKLIGEGAFSKVKLGVHMETGQKVAIKIIDKKLMAESNEKSNQDKAKRALKMGIKRVIPAAQEDSSTANFINKLENEVQLLMRLDHPNIIKTYQVIDSEEECYIVMQYASGGEMMEYLAAQSKLSEIEARKFFAQLISGLDHIHQASIVHRDLKLENLLLDEKNNILITDFGLGRTFDSEKLQLLDTFCGTPHYAAVELVSAIPYVGVKSDIWALGVIIYFFVTGSAPFSGETISELYDNIKRVRYNLGVDFSPELIDLLDKIFRKNPQDRITLDEMREHPWVHVNGKIEIPSIPPKLSGKVDSSKLGQVVKSINSDKAYQVYTFNYHDQQKTSNSKAAVLTKQRSNSAALARRKSISLMPAAIADQCVKDSISNIDKNIGAQSISNNFSEDAIDIRARNRRPTLTERPSFLPPNLGIAVESDHNLENMDSSYKGSKEFQNQKEISITEGSQARRAGLRRAASDVGKQKGRLVNIFVTSSVPRQLVASNPAVEPALLEESEDQPSRLPLSSPSKGPKSVETNQISSTAENTDGVLSYLNQANISDSNNFERIAPDAVKKEMSGARLIRRLSMVSKPMDSSDGKFAEDSAIANLDISSLPMEEIAEWHEFHRPPKEIRAVKFNFRKGTSSALLDPASMFQEVHKVLASLPEFSEKTLTFKRHPEYYDFICMYKIDGKETVQFDVEICKVWLLDVHAVKIKRRQGDAYHFKRFYDKIVDGLNWSK